MEDLNRARRASYSGIGTIYFLAYNIQSLRNGEGETEKCLPNAGMS